MALVRARLNAGYATGSFSTKPGVIMRVVPVGPRIVRPARVRPAVISPEEDPRMYFGASWH